MEPVPSPKSQTALVKCWLPLVKADTRGGQLVAVLSTVKAALGLRIAIYEIRVRESAQPILSFTTSLIVYKPSAWNAWEGALAAEPEPSPKSQAYCPASEVVWSRKRTGAPTQLSVSGALNFTTGLEIFTALERVRVWEHPFGIGYRELDIIHAGRIVGMLKWSCIAGFRDAIAIVPCPLADGMRAIGNRLIVEFEGRARTNCRVHQERKRP